MIEQISFEMSYLYFDCVSLKDDAMRLDDGLYPLLPPSLDQLQISVVLLSCLCANKATVTQADEIQRVSHSYSCFTRDSGHFERGCEGN